MFRKVMFVITYPLRLILMGLVYVYKYCISPLLPHTCRFYPTCSTYAVLALKEFGFFKGSYLAIKRILKCVPNGKSGLDLLPLNIKGDLKWLI